MEQGTRQRPQSAPAGKGLRRIPSVSQSASKIYRQTRHATPNSPHGKKAWASSDYAGWLEKADRRLAFGDVDYSGASAAMLHASSVSALFPRSTLVHTLTHRHALTHTHAHSHKPRRGVKRSMRSILFWGIMCTSDYLGGRSVSCDISNNPAVLHHGGGCGRTTVISMRTFVHMKLFRVASKITMTCIPLGYTHRGPTPGESQYCDSP